MKKYAILFLALISMMGTAACTGTAEEQGEQKGTPGVSNAPEITDTPETTPTPTPGLIATKVTAASFRKKEVVYEASKSDGSLVKIGSTRVSVHDPSVVFYDGYYYIFGSHRAFARTKDLANWKQFKINISDASGYEEVFAENFAWSALNNPKYNPSGNMWAPDVIYNTDMKKWCMYMSINGDDHDSSIAMATADEITGPYTYAGTVVFSGFTTAEEAKLTDFSKVTGSNEVPQRYVSGVKWNSHYGTNAIDPCVLYDKDGNLWMGYGSWFGGLFLLKLDNQTGLRDYTYTYETTKDVSDEYLGLRISGGYGRTGEGSYIVWDEEAGYYYLYISYCGLDATDNFSGYHIRLFRSENITGPYVDAKGNTGICTSASTSQVDKGIKLFGNYSFSSLSEAPSTSNARKGYMSGGHNSALIDTDGARYLIYHTRFNIGSEFHQVRVHQQFLNEEGWPVTAVYEYRGSKISDTGYAAEEIIGTYEYVNHGLAAATTLVGMLDTLTVTLNEDGTVTGDVTGEWQQDTGADGKGYYATMVLNDVVYRGVFFKQYNEASSSKEVMTFSLIGENDTSVWGSRLD